MISHHCGKGGNIAVTYTCTNIQIFPFPVLEAEITLDGEIFFLLLEEYLTDWNLTATDAAGPISDPEETVSIELWDLIVGDHSEMEVRQEFQRLCSSRGERHVKLVDHLGYLKSLVTEMMRRPDTAICQCPVCCREYSSSELRCEQWDSVCGSGIRFICQGGHCIFADVEISVTEAAFQPI